MRSELDQIICKQLRASVQVYIRLNALPTDEPLKDLRCPITDGRNEAQAFSVFTPVSLSRTRRTGLKVTRRRERLERPDSAVMTGNAFACFVTMTGD